MEWTNELQLILDLALRGGSNGIFWILLGAIGGFTASVVLIGAAWVYASKKKWPSEERTGLMCRWGLLIYLVITTPTALASAGAGWGIIKAVNQTVHNEQLIKKASVAGMSEMVAGLYVSFSQDATEPELTDEEVDALVYLYMGNERKIDLDELESIIKDLENLLDEGAVAYVEGKFQNEDGRDKSGLAVYITKKVWTWLIEGRVDQITQYATDVIDDVRDRQPSLSSEATIQDISFSIGSTHIKPLVDKEVEKFQKATLVLGGLQIFVFAGIPIGVIHLLFWNKRRDDS